MNFEVGAGPENLETLHSPGRLRRLSRPGSELTRRLTVTLRPPRLYSEGLTLAGKSSPGRARRRARGGAWYRLIPKRASG